MPARLPKSVKQLRGTARKCRERPGAAEVDPCAVPPPPRGLPPAEREVWLELAPQVEHLRCYDQSGFTAYRLLVRLVTAALYGPENEPPSARSRNLQAANAALAAWGLRPADRERVSSVPRREESGFEEFLAGRTPASPALYPGGDGGEPQ